MMEHPVVLAAVLAVVAFFVWQWIDVKRPAREPAFRPSYLAARKGMRWVGVALLCAGVLALVFAIAAGPTPLGLFAIAAIFVGLLAWLAPKTSPR